MSEPKLSPTVESEFKKWRKTLKPYEEHKIRMTATNLHIHLTKYPEVALRLHFICTFFKKNWNKNFFVGEALGEFFAKYLELSVEEFEMLVKPADTLTQLENKVKEYCRLVKRKKIPDVVYYDWEKEKVSLNVVKELVVDTVQTTFKLDWTLGMVRDRIAPLPHPEEGAWWHELEKIKKLQAKKHYGLFARVLDLFSEKGLNQPPKKFRKKLDNLALIVSKAEKIVADIQLSKESYLKSGKA